jgi:hypothetical protein
MTVARRLGQVVLMLLIASAARPAWAQHTATVSVPAGVTFSVADVGASTAGSPSATQITWSTAVGFTTSEKLRVSVQAASTTFSGPGTTRIAASKVSWTASASSGNPSNGTLAASAYTQVYVSPNKLLPTSSGTITLNWTLAAIAAAGLRSGTHTLTVRWKFEAF